jgi:hypothetical protein
MGGMGERVGLTRICLRLILAIALLLGAGLIAGRVRAATPHKGPALSIRVISPTHPVTVPVDGKIPVQVAVTGIKMDMAAMGRKSVPGEGHYHFYVDCIPSIAYVRNNNLGACWAGATAATMTVFDLSTSHVKVSPGTHILFLALAQNDHVLYRAAPAAVTFTVIAPAMHIWVVSPTHPVTVPVNGKIPIQVAVSGIKMDMAAMGRSNVPGVGHYHLYVDCIPSIAYVRNNNLGACWAGATAATKTDFDLSTSHVKVTSGTHILLIALARNDHILYKAPAADVIFTVVKP